MNKIIHGNALEVLRTLPDNYVSSCITSPPYWQLRKYEGIPDYIWDGEKDCEHSWKDTSYNRRSSDAPSGINRWNDEAFENLRRDKPIENSFCIKCEAWKGQLGLEPTFELYLNHLWQIFDEVKRVLREDGTCWVNLGDTYSGSGAGQKDTGKASYCADNFRDNPVKTHLPAKCLVLIPHRFAIGMMLPILECRSCGYKKRRNEWFYRDIDNRAICPQCKRMYYKIESGWILRNDIIWAKRNGMPESCKDRFSKKHEYVFFFVKNKKYYFDLDGVRINYVSKDVIKDFERANKVKHSEHLKDNNISKKCHNPFSQPPSPLGKNPGNVSDFWDIPTKPSSAKHYATFNSDLIDKPIIAGTPKDSIVLDPFAGTSTTLIRAYQLGRRFIGIEGSEQYYKESLKRIKDHTAQEKLF